MQILNSRRLLVISEGAESDTSDVTSGVVDMLGSDSVLFLASLAAATADTEFTIDGSNDGETWVSIDASEVIGGRTAAIELVRPRKRFLRLAIGRPTEVAVERCYAFVAAGVQPAQQAADDTTAAVLFDDEAQA